MRENIFSRCTIPAKYIPMCLRVQILKVTSQKAHLYIVLIGVEHDDTVAQDVNHVRIVEEGRALLMIPLPKSFHDPIDLLGLSRQAERLQVHPDGHVKAQPCTTHTRPGQHVRSGFPSWDARFATSPQIQRPPPKLGLPGHSGPASHNAAS
jgi:hypothetical protein